MGKSRTPPCLFWLLACLCFTPIVLADEEADALKKLKQVQTQIKTIQNKLDNVTKERAELNKSLRSAEQAIGQLHNKIRDVSSKINDNQRQVNQLEADKKQLVERERRQRDIMREHIVAVYAMGRQSRLKLMLNEENPEQIARTLVYYESLRDARQEVIAEYRQTLQDLERIGPQLDASRASLENHRRELESQRDALDKQQGQRRDTVAKLNRDIANKQQELQQLKRDQEQLQDILDALQEAIANMVIPTDFAPFTTRKGKLNWPAKGKHLNRFDTLRSADMKWQGITIAANEGSEVKAIHSGRVVFADWLKGYGLLIIVDHGQDYLSLYANNQSLLKALGDWINPGESIATVGRSGGRDNASVYFEIRYQGQAVNPADWCQ